MVPPSSDRISRVPPYLSYAQFLECVFAYGAITHYGCTFQSIPLTQSITHTGSSAFARHYLRNLGLFLFLGVLRCFSSPGSPPLAYVFSQGYPCGWVSPFGYRGIKAPLPAPPRFTQACTSFIACDRQGIHHMHFFA